MCGYERFVAACEELYYIRGQLEADRSANETSESLRRTIVYQLLTNHVIQLIPEASLSATEDIRRPSSDNKAPRIEEKIAF